MELLEASTDQLVGKMNVDVVGKYTSVFGAEMTVKEQNLQNMRKHNLICNRTQNNLSNEQALGQKRIYKAHRPRIYNWTKRSNIQYLRMGLNKTKGEYS